MRALVLGARGQLGVDLAREACRRGHDVQALTRSQLDITDAAAVESAIRAFRPGAVFNAAAYNQVDRAESEPWAAMAVNAAGVRNVALACRTAKAVLVHYSTDMVFAGDATSPYSEADPTGPKSAYGASKLAGERLARECCPSHYVLRAAAVYGPPGKFTRRGNFAELVLAKCRGGGGLGVVRDRYVSPTFGPALAARSLDAVEAGIPHGLYHLAGGEAVSWHAFAVEIAHASGAQGGVVRPIGADQYPAAAQRPRYAALSNRRIEVAGIRRMPALAEAVRLYVDRRAEEPRDPLADLSLEAFRCPAAEPA